MEKKVTITVGSERLKRGFAKMQKGGVIMDVVNAEQAEIAEKAGAVAVMALERVPADIRAAGGVARMADPQKVKEVIESVTIPVMAKCRIGHFAEAQVLESLGADMVDESEVLTPVDDTHIDKAKFTVPFVCGARNLGEALRRINEGAAMIRTKGEPGTGDVAEAVRHMTILNSEIAAIKEAYEKGDTDFLAKKAEEYRVPVELVTETAKLGRLTVVNFAAGGIATPSDASLMMQMGSDGIFVGSGIFKSDDPEKFARAIVEATNNYDDPAKIAEISKGLGEAMKGVSVANLKSEERMQDRSE
jgi:pyridoxal 5'-phosphate synthase pdxS subunit